MRQILSALSVLTALTLHAQPPSYVPTNGIVGWWPFNGNANDESGNGNNGTVNGATLTQDRFGNPNAAYSFDGINDYLQISDNQSLDSVGDISISFWIVPSSLGPYRIVSKTTNNSSDSYMVDLSAQSTNMPIDRIRFIVANTNIPQPQSGPFGLSVFQTFHVIVTYNQSIVAFYVNGDLVNLFPKTGNTLANNNPLRIAANSQLNGNWFHGVIDDIGIWNRALDPCEIQSLYNASIGSNVGISSTPVSFSGLSTSYNTSDAPSTLVGSPSGGYFIGPGVVGNTFNPSAAGEGNHSITYTWFDACGGFNTYGLCTSVSLGMGLEPGTDVLGGLKVFPNPNRGQFTVELDLTGLVGMQVFDARGALVHNEVFTASGSRTQRTLDLSAFAKGSYTMLVDHDGQRVSQTVVVE